MQNKLMNGVWRYMLEVPPFLWERQVRTHKAKVKASLGFMSSEHRRVHHFVVRELPGYGKPMPPEYVAESLDLPLDRVVSLLDDLEKNLTFLYRNSAGRVVWAYPVTVEPTPHRLTFSTGEELFAA